MLKKMELDCRLEKLIKFYINIHRNLLKFQFENILYVFKKHIVRFKNIYFEELLFKN